MSSATPWKYADFSQHYFAYFERTDATDLLWPLGSAGQLPFSHVASIVDTFARNLRDILHATTVPFYVAMLTTNVEKNRIIQDLLGQARSGDRAKAHSAAHILEKGNEGLVDSPFEAFRTIKAKAMLDGPFNSLYTQAAVMAWGTYETLLFECTASLFTRKPQLYAALDRVKAMLWGRKPFKIEQQVRDLTAASPTMTADAAFQSIGFLTVQLDRLAPITDLVDPSGALRTQTDNVTLRILQARRSLFVHKGGVVDQKYVTDTADAVTVGDKLKVTPSDLERYFRAVTQAGTAFARAVDS